MSDVYEDLHACLDRNLEEDRSFDPDQDGLLSIEEWDLRTAPCNPDTDFGGESDLSEVSRGANPFDPRDDAILRPIDPEVVNWIPDHFLPAPELRPESNLIRYPSSALYQRMRLWRGPSPSGPFVPIVDFVPDGTALYRDTGLTNGTLYCYRVQGLGFSGVTSAPSHVFCGTPQADPYPPLGAISIAGGAPFTESANVTLELPAQGEPKQMRLSNDPTLAGAPWQAYQAQAPWTLAPDPVTGYALAFARFRDVNQNESAIVQDDITVVPAGTLGSIVGVALLEGQSDHMGIAVLVTSSAVAPPAYTAGTGSFALTGLPAGSYDLEFSRAGYQTETRTAVPVAGGGATQIERSSV